MIIQSVLKYLAGELNLRYDNLATPSQEDFIKIGNIARLESGTGASNADLQKKVVLSLVNISEEKTLKNNPHYISRGEAKVKRNPTLYLNLYVLFSCADENYDTALGMISRVIAFFQEKYVFTLDNSLAPTAFPSDYVEKLILDIHSLSFEQMNHLWGILGGKYHPSVLYQVRLLPVQAPDSDGGPLVREVKATENAH